MSEIKDGGPAFPSFVTVDEMHDSSAGGWREVRIAQSGMTLRDYFAAKALQGGLAASGMEIEQPEIDRQCGRAYRYADAMLAAREAKQ